MVRKRDLTNAMVDSLRQCPLLVAELSPPAPESIIGYIDSTPDRNSVTTAIYQMRAGTIMVVYRNTMIVAPGDIEAFAHYVDIVVKAQRGKSSMDLADDIAEAAIPDPNCPDCTNRWRDCPVLPQLLPPTLMEIARETDEEMVDYFVIHTETKETGDFYGNSSTT